jgi:phenylalanyl-tRNA synthetase alpha subunit
MNHQGQGDSTKTCINEVVDKICDLFKCTARRVFPTKNSPCNKSDKPWFNKSCLQKRKKFHTAKYSYRFVKNKENCDAMKKTCNEFKQEMNKSYKNHQQKLEYELRKTSKQDSKTFWKILNRFSKKGTDKNIKITIDQLYEYFKSLNENEKPNTDEINLDEHLDNIDHQDIINILRSGYFRGRNFVSSKKSE